MERLITWVEIPAVDFERAVDFYNEILNLKLETKESGKDKKAFLPNGEGVIFYTPGFKPSREGVIINFYVGSRLDRTMEKIKEKGGTIVKSRTKIEAEGDGYYALFIDSEGNKLGLNGR